MHANDRNVRKTFLSALRVMYTKFYGVFQAWVSSELLIACSLLRNVIQTQDSVVAYSGDLHIYKSYYSLLIFISNYLMGFLFFVNRIFPFTSIPSTYC